MTRPRLVPELYCSHFARTLRFYTDILGFIVRYSRPDERFAYLDLGGAELMIEQTLDPSRTFLAGDLQYPFGRGVHLQIEIDDADVLYGRAQAADSRIFLPIEDRWYKTGEAQENGNRQFIVMDPDGYLLRFWHDLGSRTVSADS